MFRLPQMIENCFPDHCIGSDNPNGPSLANLQLRTKRTQNSGAPRHLKIGGKERRNRPGTLAPGGRRSRG
jgi:hypothetical protein